MLTQQHISILAERNDLLFANEKKSWKSLDSLCGKEITPDHTEYVEDTQGNDSSDNVVIDNTKEIEGLTDSYYEFSFTPFNI